MLVLIVALLVCSSCAKNKSDGVFKVVDGKEIFMNGDSQIIDRLVTYDGEQYYISEDGTKVKNDWAVIDNCVHIQIFKGGFVKVGESEYLSASYEYHITLREENGSQVSFTGTMVDDEIIVDNYGSEYIINCLKKSTKFKISINEDIYNALMGDIINRAYSQYLVEIEADNFSSLYWK